MVVRPHQVAAGFAACAAGQVEQVDRGHHRAIAWIGQPDANQVGVCRTVEHGRERRPARVRRQPAFGLEGVGEIAVGAAQDLVLLEAERAERVPAVLIDVAATEQQAGAVDVAAAGFGRIHEGRYLRTLEIALGDEVDHAADGIGAVDRRCAVAQHLDPVDRREGNRIQVDRPPLQTVRGDAAPVQQHQRGVGALPAQVRAGHAVVAALLLVDDAGIAGQVVRTVAGDVQVHQQLLGRGDALAIDLRPVDHRDRQRLLHIGALDARAGDRDAVERGDFGLLSCLCRLRCNWHCRGRQDPCT